MILASTILPRCIPTLLLNTKEWRPKYTKGAEPKISGCKLNWPEWNIKIKSFRWKTRWKKNNKFHTCHLKYKTKKKSKKSLTNFDNILKRPTPTSQVFPIISNSSTRINLSINLFRNNQIAKKYMELRTKTFPVHKSWAQTPSPKNLSADKGTSRQLLRRSFRSTCQLAQTQKIKNRERKKRKIVTSTYLTVLTQNLMEIQRWNLSIWTGMITC